jgi:hypothetical protein
MRDVPDHVRAQVAGWMALLALLLLGVYSIHGG